MAGFRYAIALITDWNSPSPGSHRTPQDLTTLAAREHCATRRCLHPPAYYARYEYVTGRRGRVTTASRYYCPAPAARFATQHALPWPTAAALTYAATLRTHGRELLEDRNP